MLGDGIVVALEVSVYDLFISCRCHSAILSIHRITRLQFFQRRSLACPVYVEYLFLDFDVYYCLESFIKLKWINHL